MDIFDPSYRSKALYLFAWRSTGEAGQSRACMCGIRAKETRGGLCGVACLCCCGRHVLGRLMVKECVNVCVNGQPFPCSFSLFLSLSYTHHIHHMTLLALTGLQPPLCFLINGLNRPPYYGPPKGQSVCGGGRWGGPMTVNLEKERCVLLFSMIVCVFGCVYRQRLVKRLI